MKKICFLIGAGAEGKGQLYLPNGKDFKKDIILAEKTKNIYNKINKSNSYIINNEKIIHHKAHNILYQTLKECKDEFEFNDEDNEIINSYLEYKNGNKDEIDKDISTRFLNIYKTQFYDLIDNREKSNDKNLNIFLENASFYSYIDSYFNYLRYPEKYKNECSKVMKLYYAALNSILNNIGDFNKLLDEECCDVLGFRKKLFNYIVENQKNIIDKYNENDKLYYNQIKKFKNDEWEVNVVTTNYTNFAKEIIELDDKYIVNIHGKLELFENLKTKEIKKITEFKEEDIIFPYIMIQSGVKPIISSFQIDNMKKASDNIKKSDILIVLGFNVNSDDEHITTFLRDRLNEKKVIKFVIYDPDYDKYILNIKKIFNDKIEYCQFDKSSNFENILENIKKGNNNEKSI